MNKKVVWWHVDSWRHRKPRSRPSQRFQPPRLPGWWSRVSAIDIDIDIRIIEGYLFQFWNQVSYRSDMSHWSQSFSNPSCFTSWLENTSPKFTKECPKDDDEEVEDLDCEDDLSSTEELGLPTPIKMRWMPRNLMWPRLAKARSQRWPSVPTAPAASRRMALPLCDPLIGHMSMTSRRKSRRSIPRWRPRMFLRWLVRSYSSQAVHNP